MDATETKRVGLDGLSVSTHASVMDATASRHSTLADGIVSTHASVMDATQNHTFGDHYIEVSFQPTRP